MNLRQVRSKLSKKYWGIRRERFQRDLSLTEAIAAYPDPTEFYHYLHQYYLYQLPSELRAHREYFSSEGRGFGEDAFHAMWWLIFREYRPVACLEIGVFRGQVISLWALIAKTLGYEIKIQGVGPLSARGDSVSTYVDMVDYEQDILTSFERFRLSPPILVKALSNEKKAIDSITPTKWDLFYVDGSHEYEDAKGDIALGSNVTAERGLVIVDDSSLKTNYRPPSFAFKGHPGPSRAISELGTSLRHIATAGHNNILLKIGA